MEFQSDHRNDLMLSSVELQWLRWQSGGFVIYIFSSQLKRGFKSPVRFHNEIALLGVTWINGYKIGRMTKYQCTRVSISRMRNGYNSLPIINMNGRIRCHVSCRRWPKSWISIITALTVLVLWAEEINYNWYKTNKQTKQTSMQFLPLVQQSTEHVRNPWSSLCSRIIGNFRRFVRMP